MTWQRVARVVVALIGVGCAVALVMSTRQRPTPVVAPPQVAIDPKATVQGGAGRTVRHRGDKELGVIEYQSSKTYDDGRMVFEKPHIVSSDERGFEATADLSETKGKSVHADNPGEMEFTGHVHVKTKDGLELHSDSAVYDDTTGGIRVPGPVTFSRARMTGQGVGAIYDRTVDVLTVLDQAHVNVTPDPDGKGAMTAVSKTMTMDRVHKVAKLEQGAVITHDTEKLTGDTATLDWTEDEKQLRLIELRGHASVVQAANAGAGSPPDMHADDIDLTFHPDGHTVHLAALTGRTALASLVLIDAAGRRSISGSQINAAVAPDGSTLTNLESKNRVKVELPKTVDNPARVITAQTLVAQGTEKEGLKQARFDGGVEFLEMVPGARGAKDSVRTGKSRVLVLALNGQIDAIDRATFSQDATFTDTDMRGEADQADYFASQGKLSLRPAPRDAKKLPHVVDGGLQVDAKAIDININTNDLEATGDVKTVNRPAANAPPDTHTSALFDFNDPNRPIYGTSDKLVYVDDAGRATYTGTPERPAQTRQDQNVVTGDQVVLETNTHNLRATGHVKSTYFLAPAPPPPGTQPANPPPKPAEYRGDADSLDYKDADRVATYVGVPATLKGIDGTTTAPRIDVTFNDAGNDVDKLDATGGAYALLDGNREAVGQRLIYTASNDTYTLTGSTAMAARVKLPNSDHTECTKSMGERLTFTRLSGSADGARQTTKLESCSVSIKDPVK